MTPVPKKKMKKGCFNSFFAELPKITVVENSLCEIETSFLYFVIDKLIS